ncbi:hypothetical protein GCM10019996_05030 [Lentilactobacillus parakefiri]
MSEWFLDILVETCRINAKSIKSIFYFYLKVKDTFIVIKNKGDNYENRTDSSYQYVEI